MLRNGPGVPVDRVEQASLLHSLLSLLNGLDFLRGLFYFEPVEDHCCAHCAGVHFSFGQLRELQHHGIGSPCFQRELPELEHFRLHLLGCPEGVGTLSNLRRHQELTDNDDIELGHPVLLPTVLLRPEQVVVEDPRVLS